MTLGKEIRYYRKKKGLTQTAFGALFGMSKQAVYSWETGLYSPDILVGRPGMYCKGSEEHGNSCDFCASITEDDSHIIRAIHALPPEKQEAIKTLLNINGKK